MAASQLFADAKASHLTPPPSRDDPVANEVPTMPDPLPRREVDLLRWTANLRNHLLADPLPLGITPQQAADYSVVQESFAQAFRTTRDPGAAAPSTFVAKRDALKSLKIMTRQLTRIIRAHPQVTDAQRSTLGLKPRRRGRGTPIPPPREAPWMHVISVNGGIAKVRLFDRERPTNKGKPRGVDRIVVLRYVGEHPPRNLKEWNYARMAGKTKFEVEIPANTPPGTSVWLTAQWVNAKGQRGPGCSPVNLHLGYVVPRFGRLAA